MIPTVGYIVPRPKRKMGCSFLVANHVRGRATERKRERVLPKVLGCGRMRKVTALKVPGVPRDFLPTSASHPKGPMQ